MESLEFRIDELDNGNLKVDKMKDEETENVIDTAADGNITESNINEDFERFDGIWMTISPKLIAKDQYHLLISPYSGF
jgi:hypothetical protein